jgi:GTP pyrophosphokinase
MGSSRNNLENFLIAINRNPLHKNDELIRQAYFFAQKAHRNQKRKSGKPYVIHPIETAKILSKWQQDDESIIAALLHDVIEDTPFTAEDIKNQFGEKISALVAGVTKVSKVDFHGNREEKLAANLKKMFLAMSKDLRIIIIKSADRLHNMKTVQHLPKKRKVRFCQETKNLYAPLAYKMGMNEVSGNLLELCFKNLEPEKYNWVKEFTAQEVTKREKTIKNINKHLVKLFENKPTKLIKTKSRKKRLHSLYEKLHRKEINKKLDEIYDLVISCIVVPEKIDCYTALGIIHEKYKPMPHVGISDFIAQPKPNGYQALHTRVFDKSTGTVFEIQIRDKKMHQRADLGLAAHLSLAETNSVRIKKIRYWTKKLIEWQESFLQEESKRFLGELKGKVLQPEICVIDKELGVVCLQKNTTVENYLKKTNRSSEFKILVDKKQLKQNTVLSSGSFIEII